VFVPPEKGVLTMSFECKTVLYERWEEGFEEGLDITAQ
jgi:hypothetical protein